VSVYLGRAAAVKRLLKGALMLRPFERAAGKRHWVSQSQSRLVAVEVEGDPVRRVSVTMPVSPGAGTILAQVINEFHADSATVRAWAEKELLAWGARLGEDPDAGLDVLIASADRSTRLQRMGTAGVLLTITV